jgi:transposase
MPPTQTVRERFHRFNKEGLDGLGDRPGAGRNRRITETERSLIISLVATDPPPGRLVRGAGGELEARDEEREARWTLYALTTAARERGIAVGRSQVYGASCSLKG